MHNLFFDLWEESSQAALESFFVENRQICSQRCQKYGRAGTARVSLALSRRRAFWKIRIFCGETKKSMRVCLCVSPPFGACSRWSCSLTYFGRCRGFNWAWNLRPSGLSLSRAPCSNGSAMDAHYAKVSLSWRENSPSQLSPAAKSCPFGSVIILLY
jgi:hypothetical protein